MGPERPKRPSRLAWFAMDVDAFLDDPRMQCLTNKEKSAWALMLIRSFRNKGMMSVDPVIISEQTGLAKKEAEALLMKLYNSHLIVSTPPEEATFDGMSNRMAAEYEITKTAYERYSNMGQSSAEKNGTRNLKIVK